MKQVLISGYDSPGSIALYAFDEKGGAQQIWFDTIPSPSFAAFYENELFAVTETAVGGMVHCYKKQAGGYIRTDSLEIPGDCACHLVYLPEQHLLVLSCYISGHVIGVEVQGGRFNRVSNQIRLTDPAYDLTGIHCCMPSPRQNFVYAVNIAHDRIYCFQVKNGILVRSYYLPFLQLPQGCGPRHLLFHPTLPAAYVITEYSSEVIVLSCRGNGELSPIQTLSILPPDFAGESTGSALALSQSGLLYAANRGADTIAVFTVDPQTGRLGDKEDFSAYGTCPRHITLSEDGRRLWAANQTSGEAVCIDTATRRPIAVIPFGHPAFAMEPPC